MSISVRLAAVEQEGSGLAALSGLDDPVRGRLYRFVSGQAEPVGRDEAAAAVGIGRPLAAYHLDKLARAEEDQELAVRPSFTCAPDASSR